jgi:ketosteroid isomerase-like protein
MKHSVWIGAALSLAMLLPGGAMAQEPSVTELANRWVEAYNTADAAALGALYSPDAQLYLSSEPRFIGREDIQAVWNEDMGIGAPLTLLTVTDSTQSVDMVLVHGNYQVVDRNSGVELAAGRFAHIWVLQDGGEWLLDRDLWVQR